MDLVALKVKIGLANRGALYPAFNSLPTVASSGLDWSQYIDQFGSGWLYDCCGHKEEDAASPRGIQFGMILVPESFAVEAVTSFPNQCEILSPMQAERFYDDRHARDFDDEEIDERVLKAIKAKQDLGIALTQKQLDAIDPSKPERGIRANRRKKFTTFLADRGIHVTTPNPGNGP